MSMDPGRRSRVLLVLLAAAWSGAPEPVRAQEAAQDRRFTAAAGLGNSFGWLGVSGEAYLEGSRLSVFGALGYTPSVRTGQASGATVAGGIRAYTLGSAHRGFLELGFSQIGVTAVDAVPLGDFEGPEGDRYYGPGLQAGYQHVSGNGLTVLVSAGVGYALGLDPEVSGGPTALLLGLGLGYTAR